MHLDLSSTGLTWKMFNVLAENWRKYMSLVTLHCSNNPFIRQIPDWNELLIRLKSKPLLDYKQIPDFQEMREILKPKGNHELMFLKQVRAHLAQLKNETEQRHNWDYELGEFFV